jgi:valyl-tRNA synthetase
VVCAEVNRSLEEYRFNDSAGILYQFMWHELCDWYVEMIKPELYGENEQSREAALSALIHVYEVSLALLHPFMPFITEEIWQQLPAARSVRSLCIRPYPENTEGRHDSDAEERMNILMEAVSGIRSIRGELNISPSLELTASIRATDGRSKVLSSNLPYLLKLARAKELIIGEDIQAPQNAATAIRSGMEIYVPLKGLIDIDVEIKRLRKEHAKVEKELLFIKKKLANEDFRAKAPKAVVEENQEKYEEYQDSLEGIQASIDKLKKWAEEES